MASGFASAVIVEVCRFCMHGWTGLRANRFSRILLPAAAACSTDVQ
jgi:hypothetical protein